MKKEGEASFLLTDKRGGYFSLANKENNLSHYQGWFVFLPEKWMPFKVIENIRLNKEPDIVENHFYKIVRRTGDVKEKFLLTQDALIYQAENYDGDVSLDLDFREVHDFTRQGRIYSIKKHKDAIIIEYNKFDSDKLDKLLGTYYLVIKGAELYTKTENWALKTYPYDRERGTISEFYVYEALKIKVFGKKNLVFCFSQDKEQALGTAAYVYSHINIIEGSLKKYFEDFIKGKDFAWDCARKALDDLTITLPVEKKETTGIFAGLPWFFYYWSRDELLSLSGLLAQEKYDLVKDIITRYFEKVKSDGRLPNRYPDSELGSADAIGWLCKRTNQFLEMLQRKGKLKEYYSTKELDTLRKQVMIIIDKLRTAYEKEGLIYNRFKETWMDTDYHGDLREGARIEIQALQLAIYKLAQFLCALTSKKDVKTYVLLETELREKTRKLFFKENLLADGYNDDKPDFTIRPNIFLAHYAYPELLSRKEWKLVFEKALAALWCDWGGSSSIDKAHPWYKPKHTGFNNESYHRGDSWFFVNNIAAISMHCVDKDFFKPFINKILEASKEECLYKGYMGHCAEISDAFNLSSKGCWAQAWSAATLIEAISVIEK